MTHSDWSLLQLFGGEGGAGGAAGASGGEGSGEGQPPSGCAVSFFVGVAVHFVPGQLPPST